MNSTHIDEEPLNECGPGEILPIGNSTLTNATDLTSSMQSSVSSKLADGVNSRSLEDKYWNSVPTSFSSP